ncbi:MAG: Cell division protein FtsL [Gemmatimonadetes bacterium]|nr:Cell division protein FtsL [Gemmatimonadota bacterium]
MSALRKPRPAAPPRPRQSAAELPRGARARRPGSGRGRALLKVMVFAAVVLSAFSAVVWRQTRAAERQRELKKLEADVAVAEGEKAELLNRIQALQSRARITRVARERLGLHLPSDSEIVLLPLPAGADDDDSAAPPEVR